MFGRLVRRSTDRTGLEQDRPQQRWPWQPSDPLAEPHGDGLCTLEGLAATRNLNRSAAGNCCPRCSHAESVGCEDVDDDLADARSSGIRHENDATATGSFVARHSQLLDADPVQHAFDGGDGGVADDAREAT